jgi:type II secretory pathway pseudopilin PulG
MTDNLDAAPNPDDKLGPLKNGFRFSLIHFLTITAIVGIIGMFLLPAAQRARFVSRLTHSRNNLKQIGLALSSYHDEYGSLPPAYTVDANGKPLHSWRTLILPQLGELALYQRIDLSKAWDDPANTAAFRDWPMVYRCPWRGSAANQTTYVAVVEPSSAFPRDQVRTFKEIKDGLSNTLLVIEVPSDKSVPWMSPLDATEQQFLQLGSKAAPTDSERLHVLMGDLSIQILGSQVTATTRHAFITVDGGEPVGVW